VFSPTLDVMAHLGPGGTLRALGFTLQGRLPAMPDVPAIAEVVPGYSVSNWFAIFAPARFPEDLRSRLVQALASLRDGPELKAYFTAGAALPRLDGPDPLAKRLTEDTAQWTELIKKLGIKSE
jgi:tripartite-type tricarboxylate transporter receptor subunit TctC